jgi:lysophospholipase L1-like esterase
MSFVEGEITVEFGGTVGPAGPAGNAVPIAAGTVLANPSGVLANPVGVDAAGMRDLIDAVGYVIDSPGNFTSTNVVLANNQIGIETGVSPRRFKIGDGTTAWNSLPYSGDPNPWVTKKAAILGTSITSQGFYTSRLTALGLNVTNLGVSGSSLSSSASSGGGVIYGQIANIPTDTELVLFEAGINDFRTNATLGTIVDTTLSTFYGAIYLAIRDVALRVPAATIVFLLPFGNTDTNYSGTWRTNNDNSVSLAAFRKAISDVCQQTSVATIDLAESTVGPRTVAQFMPDGIHPNSAGGIKIGDTIWSKLKDLTPNTASSPGDWVFRTVEASDFSVSNMTGGTLTGDDFTSGTVVTGSFGANWFNAGLVNNAIEFESSVGWIAVGEGTSGFCAFGDAATNSITYFSTIASGAITHVLWGSTEKTPATKFRVARVGDLLFLDQYVGASWQTVVNGIDIDTLNPDLAGYKENAKLGLMSNVATINNIRVGVYNP